MLFLSAGNTKMPFLLPCMKLLFLKVHTYHITLFLLYENNRIINLNNAAFCILLFLFPLKLHAEKVLLPFQNLPVPDTHWQTDNYTANPPDIHRDHKSTLRDFSYTFPLIFFYHLLQIHNDAHRTHIDTLPELCLFPSQWHHEFFLQNVSFP